MLVVRRFTKTDKDMDLLKLLIRCSGMSTLKEMAWLSFLNRECQ